MVSRIGATYGLNRAAKTHRWHFEGGKVFRVYIMKRGKLPSPSPLDVSFDLNPLMLHVWTNANICGHA